MLHVMPINDIKEHTQDSTCHCAPKVENESGVLICIHNSFDGREKIEIQERPELN